MSRLARFQRRPEILEFDLEDEQGNPLKEKIKVTPLKVKDQDLIMEMTGLDRKEAKAAAAKILKKVLVDNGIDDYTEEEFQEMDWEFADAILNSVIKLNTSNATDAKARFLAEIKAKQEASRKKKEEAKGSETKEIFQKVTGHGKSG